MTPEATAFRDLALTVVLGASSAGLFACILSAALRRRARTLVRHCRPKCASRFFRGSAIAKALARFDLGLGTAVGIFLFASTIAAALA